RNLLPGWAQEGGVSAMLERLAHPAIRERIRHDLARDGLNNFGRIPSWDVVRIAGSPSHPADAGLNFGALARRRGIDPLDAVFDPDTVASLATYDEPHQYAAGISTVIVNGTVVIDGGDHTGALPGRVLRFPRRAA